MRKFLLLSMALSFGLISFAQKKGSLVTEDQKTINKKVVYKHSRSNDLSKLEQSGNNTVSNYIEKEGFETIGHTWYDAQTNTSVDNRICTFDDGTMAAVFTFGPEGQDPGFSGRGAGYNYFDGSSWGPSPTERIETDRCGWPAIARLGENGEIVVSHYAGDLDGIAINTRPTKGTGEWTEVMFEGINGMAASFPKMITNGEDNNTIHMIYSFLNEEYMGIEDPGFYNRSTDGGATWDIQHLMLEGMTADEYTNIGGDNMTWANSVGNTIAFAFANTWYTDLVVMKSENNGEDWEKIVIWEHPYPFFDWNETIMTDSLWAPDGATSIALDANGKVHLVAGLCRVIHDELGDNYTLWQYGEGILYWNEDRPPFEADNPHDALNAWDEEILVPDVDLIGWGQDLDGDDEFTLYNDDLFTYPFTIGASTMPAISCGNNGKIVVAWSGISEIDVYNEEYNYKRIFARASPDNGDSWTEHFYVNSDITQSFDECVWPVLNKSFEDEYHLMYQADYDVGIALDGDHEWLDNRIIYFKDWPWWTGVQAENMRQLFVSQNYPNPATSTTRIHVDLAQKGVNLSLEVSNLIGQIVYSENREKVCGAQNVFEINVANYTPGIYFYTIKVDEQSITHKMIVE